jgi:hypothetical protein
MTAKITNIVFTMNRPLQLHAYLKSLYEAFGDASLFKTVIIYKPELFKEEYERVFSEFKGCQVVCENVFHRDFMNVMQSCQTPYTLFGIDDVVYWNPIDWPKAEKTLETFKNDIMGYTFRFGSDYLKSLDQAYEKVASGGSNALRLDWTKATNKHAAYPFELCCTIYRTELVKKIFAGTMNMNPAARALFSPGSACGDFLSGVFSKRSIFKKFGYFFSPNTLESWPCRWCKNNADKLPKYTYFSELCATPVQVNMVNTCTKNTWDGTEDQSVEALNQKFIEGYRFDIDFLRTNKPASLSCGKEYFKLVKLES